MGLSDPLTFHTRKKTWKQRSPYLAFFFSFFFLFFFFTSPLRLHQNWKKGLSLTASRPILRFPPFRDMFFWTHTPLTLAPPKKSLESCIPNTYSLKKKPLSHSRLEAIRGSSHRNKKKAPCSITIFIPHPLLSASTHHQKISI